MIQGVKIEFYGLRRFVLCLTVHQRLALGAAHDTFAQVMAVLVVAHAVGSHQVALVLDGTCPCQYPPGLLTFFRPVGGDDDGIILPCPAVA